VRHKDAHHNIEHPEELTRKFEGQLKDIQKHT
jgi:hypothetical protein